jgi:hypothetical protein
MIKEVEKEREIVLFGQGDLPEEVSHQAELQKSTIDKEHNPSILNMSLLQPVMAVPHFTV